MPDKKDEIKAGSSGASRIAALIGDRPRPPVGEWTPPYCGESDMRIGRDGTWYYRGSPIGRRRMVRLFSSVLWREEDGRHYLVTPVEKLGIEVEDAPFVAVAMTVTGSGADQILTFWTNVGDEVAAGPDHPIRVATDPATGEPAPYVLVRDRLEALIARAVFYEMAELGEEDTIDGARVLGVWSGGKFFALGGIEEDH